MRGRNPTLREKEVIKKWGLASNDWLVTKSTPDFMEVTSRFCNKTRVIPEGLRNGRRR